MPSAALFSFVAISCSTFMLDALKTAENALKTKKSIYHNDRWIRITCKTFICLSNEHKPLQRKLSHTMGYGQSL